MKKNRKRQSPRIYKYGLNKWVVANSLGKYCGDIVLNEHGNFQVNLHYGYSTVYMDIRSANSSQKQAFNIVRKILKNDKDHTFK